MRLKLIIIALGLIATSLSLLAYNFVSSDTDQAQAGTYTTYHCNGNYGAAGGSAQLNWSGYMGATGGNANAGMGYACNSGNPARAWNTNSQWSSPVYGYRNYWNGCASRDGYGNCQGAWVCCEAYVQYYNYGWNTGSGWTKWAVQYGQGGITFNTAGVTASWRSDYGWGRGFYTSTNDWNGVTNNLGSGGNSSGYTVQGWNLGVVSSNPNMIRYENYGGSATLGSDGYGPFGWIYVYDLQNNVADWWGPSTSASPKSSWTRGTQNVVVNWSDNSGLKDIITGSAASSGNGQSDLWMWAQSPGCNYIYTKPCSDQSPTTSYDTTSYAWGGNGYKTLSYLANDASGNSGTASSAIAIDNSAPTTSVGLNNGGASTNSYSSNNSWSVSCSDNGPSGCNSVSTDNGSSYTAGSSASSTVSSCGANTVYGASRDNAVDNSNNVGNTSYASGTKYFDNCAPTNNTVIPNFVWRASGASVITACAADSHAGGTTTNFSVTPSGGSATTSSVSGSSASITPVGAGVTALSVWCADALGNTSNTVAGTVLLDNSAPTVSGSCPSSWSSTTVTCTVSSSDTFSGLNTTTGFRWWRSGAAQANATMTPGTSTVTATGGTTTDITQNGQTYRVHRFNSSGTFSITSAPGGTPVPIEYLVVGGGGGGGMDMGGGGGGGGVLEGQTTMTSGTNYTVTVGNGGNGGPAGCSGSQPCDHQFTQSATNGGNSSISGTGFAGVTAIGGGFGGSSYWNYTPNSGNGNSGGSGGGVSGYSNGTSRATGASGTAGQGNAGGGSPGQYYSGGGGGANGVGGYVTTTGGGAGGAGRASSILGTTYYFGGGGGGAAYSNGSGGAGGIGGGGGGAAGSGGAGGGSALNSGGNGTASCTACHGNVPGGAGGANTGGGGGGGAHYNRTNQGGNGGSGVVIVRYPIGSNTGTGSITVSGEGSGPVTVQTVDNVGNTSSTATLGTVKIDNTAPTGSVQDPTPSKGYIRTTSFTPTANVGDATSGVQTATIQIQYNSGAWTDLSGCTLSNSGEGVTSAIARCTPPDLSALADGSTINLRVRVTDVAGASFTSSSVSNVFQKTAPVNAVTDPTPSSPYVKGSFTPSGTATDSTSGANSDAAIQARYNSSSATAWADMSGCALATNQLTCSSFNTTTRTSGDVQDMRVRARNNAGIEDYSKTILADSPVLYAGLQESSGTAITDEGKSSGQGTLAGTASYRVAGPPALGDPYGMGFNGSTTSISFPDNNDLDPTSAATMEAWFKAGVSGSDKDIIYKEQQYALRLRSDGRITAFYYTSGSWKSVTTPASPRYDDNLWHLVDASYDGSNIRIYVDGVEVTSTAATSAINTTNNNLTVGSANGSSNFFNGSLAQVAIYPSALSAAKVLSHWQATEAGKVTNTIDNTAPVLTAPYPSGRSANGWYKSAPVTISASATDPASGVKEIRWTINGNTGSGSPASGSSASIPVSCSPSGTYTVVVTAEDNAGNTSSTTLTIQCDTTAPTMTNPCSSAWSNVDYTCNLNTAGADSLSGIQGYRVRQVDSSGNAISGWSSPTLVPPNASFTVSQNGITYWEMQSIDNADNTSASQTATIKVDKVAPSGGLPVSPDFVSGTQTLTNPTATDTHSGVATVAYRVSLTSASPASWATVCTINTTSSPFNCSWNSTATPDGLYNMYAIVTDAAGNNANSSQRNSICVDNTAPSAGATSLPTAPATVGGYPAYRGNIAASTTASDTGCGQIDKVKIQFRLQGTTTWNDTAADCNNMPATGGGAYGCTFKTGDIADGTYEIRSLSADKAGNQTGGTPRTIVVDNQGPTVTLDNIASWMKGSVPLSATASDNAGVANIKIMVSPRGLDVWTLADPSCTISAGSINCNFNSTAYQENTCFDFRAEATDAVGNVGTSSPRTNRCVDNTAPTESLQGYTSAWVKDPMSLTLSGTDGGSGLKDASWKFDLGESLTCPLASPFTATAPAAFEVSAEGVSTLCTRVSDQVDNWSSWQKRLVKIDKTAPAVAINGVPDDWTNQTPDIKIKGTDQANLSGIYKVFWKVDNGSEVNGPDNTGPTITESGSYALAAQAEDNAGNRSTTVTKQVKIDKVNPTDTTSFANGWYAASQQLTIVGADQSNLSGVGKVAWKRKLADDSFTAETEIANTTNSTNFSTVVNVGQEGINKIYTRVIDRAGNTTEPQLVEMGIDLTDPTISQSGGSNDWFNTNRTVTLSASDSVSGVQKIEWQYCNNPEPGATPAVAACIQETNGIRTGTTPYSDVTAGSETFSGQASASTTLNFTQTGERYLRARTIDRAGRSSEWVTIRVAIDKDDPSTAMAGQSARVSDVVTLKATSEDLNGVGRSGIARGWFQVCKSSDCDAPNAVWTTVDQSALGQASPCTPDLSTNLGNFECDFDTRLFSDGQYSIRSVVRDNAGNLGYGSPRLDGQRFRNGTFCPASL